VTIEEIVNGTCTSCGATDVKLYKKQGVLVCGKKTCYNDPTPVHQDSRRQKRKTYWAICSKFLEDQGILETY
jgi:hypothetical protein